MRSLEKTVDGTPMPENVKGILKYEYVVVAANAVSKGDFGTAKGALAKYSEAQGHDEFAKPFLLTGTEKSITGLTSMLYEEYKKIYEKTTVGEMYAYFKETDGFRIQDVLTQAQLRSLSVNLLAYKNATMGDIKRKLEEADKYIAESQKDEGITIPEPTLQAAYKTRAMYRELMKPIMKIAEYNDSVLAQKSRLKGNNDSVEALVSDIFN